MFIKCIIDKAQAKKLLKGQYNASRQTIESPDKLEKLLQAIERKLKIVPFVGKKISKMAVMISLVKAYLEGRYREIPIGSLIAIVAALIYFLTPVDMMPDIIPSFGFLDDAAEGLALGFQYGAEVFRRIADDVVNRCFVVDHVLRSVKDAVRGDRLQCESAAREVGALGLGRHDGARANVAKTNLSRIAPSQLVFGCRIEHQLARRVNAGEVARDGSTALLWAVYNGNVDMTRALLAAGAPVNAPNHYGITPLLQAARTGDAADVSARPREFQVRRTGSPAVVLQGALGAARTWALADQAVQWADLSALTEPGEYDLQVDGEPRPARVRVSVQAPAALTAAALKAFYFNRASTAGGVFSGASRPTHESTTKSA